MKLNTREMAVFGLLGALMFILRQVMAAFPNIHLTGVLLVAITAVYRKKALYPLYTFVFLEGLLAGFSTWWLPYLYIWTLLWGAVMLLPQTMKPGWAAVFYGLVCAAHGFFYGVLYAPAQALLFGLDFQGMLAWIAAGLPFDLIHGCSNLVCGLLIMPLKQVIEKMERAIR